MIKKNEEYEIEIIDMTSELMGVAKIDNFTIFVKDAVVGDKLTILITKVLKNYAYAKIIKIMKESNLRVKNICENSKHCGGCTRTSY